MISKKKGFELLYKILFAVAIKLVEGSFPKIHEILLVNSQKVGVMKSHVDNYGLALLRSELSDVVEIISIPILPDSKKYFSSYIPTCTCTPKLLKQVEHEIRQETGMSGNEIWGFDLKAMKYKITSTELFSLKYRSYES